MVFKTNGIVLRTVKYGENSMIVSLYTELFGIQSYIVNGARSVSRKGSANANLFQPAALLELVVYHNELKNLQRIREYKWGYLYRHLYFSVMKNCVALFMVELLQKCLKQPEPNADLFHFIEDAFIFLDESPESVTANYPLFFALHLTGFFGFGISDAYSARDHVLDLQQGYFVSEQPVHPYFLDEPYAFITSQLLKVRQPAELQEIRLNQESRRVLLHALEQFYSLHIADFGSLRTLPVLQAVL